MQSKSVIPAVEQFHQFHASYLLNPFVLCFTEDHVQLASDTQQGADYRCNVVNINNNAHGGAE